MARPLDPYRALELPRDATLEDVKAAYRRLAKLYHPDSAGDRALPRFLAIQAAYEALTEGPGRLRPAFGGRRKPAAGWSTTSSAGSAPSSGRASSRQERAGAEPGSRRASGTGRAGGGARHGARPGEPGDDAGARPGGSAGTGDRSGTTSGRSRGSGGGRPRRVRRAPGSTSYDGAESEPFEPEWEGASWYGGSSGTYWTLNPREFADPRKHGPEYARRSGARATRAHGTSPANGAAAETVEHGPTGAPAGREPRDETAAERGQAPVEGLDPSAYGPAASMARGGDPSATAVVGAALIALIVLAGLLAIVGATWARGIATALLVVAAAATIVLIVARRLGRA